MSLKWIALSLQFVLVAMGAGATTGSDPLAWPQPTMQSRPWTRWWWLGSAVDERTLTSLLEQYRDAGIGGVEICPIYGAKGYEDRYIDFLSPKWMGMLAHTTREGKRLGIGVDLTDGTGWPFGGPNVSPAEASMKVEFTQGKLATISPIQKVKRAAPGGEGNVVDPYSVSAIQHYLSRFDDAFQGFDAPMPRAHFHDSFEYFGANWTPKFFEEFKSRRGYDLREHLGALMGEGDHDTIARVKCDYRETISDLHLADIQAWTQWCHAHGGLARNQAHGAPGNLLDLYAAADIPETESFGEVDPRWMVMNKFASSAAHLTGRNLSSCESFTWLGEHFNVSLAQAKHAADYIFLTGANHIFFHGIPYSPSDVPWPGWLFYAAVNFGPEGGLWRDLPAFNAYITRCQSILQSGQSDNYLLLYFPIHDIWQDPADLLVRLNMHGQEKWLWSQPFYATGMMLNDRGYTFDAVSDRLLETVKAKDGFIEAGGHRYAAIVLPKCRLMPPQTVRKLVELSRGGAKVIVLEDLPADAPGLSNLDERRAEFHRQIEQLRQANVIVGNELPKLRREPMVDQGLSFVRRTCERGKLYFIANRSEHAFDGWTTLATSAASAALMDPRFADRNGVAATHRDAERQLQIYLQLKPGEPCIVRTFADSVSATPWDYFTAGNPAALTGSWHVHFIDGGPKLPDDVETRALASWTTLGDDEAKRFAGTARYTLEFEYQPSSADEVLLSLGNVCQTARVRLNGRDVANLFCDPFEVKVGSFLKSGRNHLEVEVTNLAANRIRDLDRRGVNWKSFHEINFVNLQYKPFDASNWPLRDSGLLGPVRLVPLKTLSP